MLVILRHVLLAAVPLAAGLGFSWGFAVTQGSCSELVGVLLSPMCRGRQLQYQMLFQTWGTAAGCLFAAAVGAWLELRRRRAATPHPGGST